MTATILALSLSGNHDPRAAALGGVNGVIHGLLAG